MSGSFGLLSAYVKQKKLKGYPLSSDVLSEIAVHAQSNKISAQVFLIKNWIFLLFVINFNGERCGI